MERLDDLDTPFLAVDRDVFERNVATCFERLAHVDIRPHQKCAKSPDVAHALVAAGARGICVAKLSEAEVMLAAGLDDILVTTELAGPIKARHLAELRRRWPEARLAIVVDSYAGASAIEVPVDVLIEVDVGQHRCGVAPEDAVALADLLRTLDHLRLRGVQGYEGNLQLLASAEERRRRCDQSMEALAGAVAALRDAGHAIDVVTTGGTGTSELCAAHDVVTEVQPGSFVFSDGAYLDVEDVPYRPALTAHATVISARPGRAVVDAGLKTMSDDLGPARVVGDGTYAHAGDEHGIITGTDLRVGDRVTLVPSHSDTTVNLHDVLHVHRKGEIECAWRVAARGKVT
jgi:D-serine deaminase-like pyridoxal phosphate-dependent protein